MPVNPLIPLSTPDLVQQVNTIDSINSRRRQLGQDDRSLNLAERQENRLQSAADFNEQAAREERLRAINEEQFKDMAIDAAGVLSSLEAGDMGSVRRQIASRAKKITERGGDNQDTLLIGSLLNQGRTDEVRSVLTDIVQQGQLRGVLPTAEAPGSRFAKPTVKDFTPESIEVFNRTGNEADLDPREPETPTRSPGSSITLATPRAIQESHSPQELMAHPETQTFLDKNSPEAIEFQRQGGRDISRLNLQTGRDEFSISGDEASIRAFNTQQGATADMIDISGRLRALTSQGGAAVMASPGAITTTVRSIASQLAGIAEVVGGGEVRDGEDVPPGTLMNPNLYQIPQEYGLVTAAMKANLIPLVYAWSRAQDPRDRVSETQVQQNFNAIAAQLNASLQGGDPDQFNQALSEIERQMLSSLNRASTQYGQPINEQLFPSGIFDSIRPQDDPGEGDQQMDPAQFQRALDEARRALEAEEERSRSVR